MLTVRSTVERRVGERRGPDRRKGDRRQAHDRRRTFCTMCFSGNVSVLRSGVVYCVECNHALTTRGEDMVRMLI